MRCDVGVCYGAQEGAATVACRTALLVDGLNVCQCQELETPGAQSHASHRRRSHMMKTHNVAGERRIPAESLQGGERDCEV